MIDIFFIDWERPKEGGNKMSADGKSVGTGSSVSIWRTYFVANEWNEIQTIRKTNVFFQLMATLFFLEVLNFKEFGRSDPSNDLFPNDQYYDSPYNPMLRFAIGCSVYIGIGLLQVSASQSSVPGSSLMCNLCFFVVGAISSITPIL